MYFVLKQNTISHLTLIVLGQGKSAPTKKLSYEDFVTKQNILKVIRKFFLTITKVLDGISEITKKHNFFPFEGL